MDSGLKPSLTSSQPVAGRHLQLRERMLYNIIQLVYSVTCL